MRSEGLRELLRISSEGLSELTGLVTKDDTSDSASSAERSTVEACPICPGAGCTRRWGPGEGLAMLASVLSRENCAAVAAEDTSDSAATSEWSAVEMAAAYPCCTGAIGSVWPLWGPRDEAFALCRKEDCTVQVAKVDISESASSPERSTLVLHACAFCAGDAGRCICPRDGFALLASILCSRESCAVPAVREDTPDSAANPERSTPDVPCTGDGGWVHPLALGSPGGAQDKAAACSSEYCIAD